MLNIAVITSVTGGRDILREDQNTETGNFVAYCDRNYGSRVWEERPACTLFKSERRNSRCPKILSHLYVDADYSVWIDGSVALRASAVTIVEDWVKDCDLAVFKHRVRGCTYEEAAVCAERQLDTPRLIESQVRRYREKGFPANAGLPECTVIVRRHSRKCEEFNHAWWAEYCRYSVRDQISFVYAAKNVGLTYRLITPTKFEHPYFDVLARPPQAELHQVQIPRLG